MEAQDMAAKSVLLREVDPEHHKAFMAAVAWRERNASVVLRTVFGLGSSFDRHRATLAELAEIGDVDVAVATLRDRLHDSDPFEFVDRCVAFGEACTLYELTEYDRPMPDPTPEGLAKSAVLAHCKAAALTWARETVLA